MDPTVRLRLIIVVSLSKGLRIQMVADTVLLWPRRFLLNMGAVG